MHSRSSTRINGSLHHSKSSSSIQNNRRRLNPAESLDPETARIHALIAAHRAMDRSRATNSTSLDRSDSAASRYTSSPVRRNHTKRNLQVSDASFYGNINSQADHYMTNSSEFGENYDAQPSSYRRLKKARSMLTPTRQWNQSRQGITQTPFSQARTLRHAASSIGSEPRELRLRLKRSFQFLNPARRTLTSPTSQITQLSCRPEAIELARQQFFETQTVQDSKDNASSYNSRLKIRQQPKSFRRTLRDDLQTLQSPSSASSAHHKSLPLETIRSMSHSLRDKFRKTLTRSKSQMDILPPQQLDASRPHFTSKSTSDNENAGFDSYYDDDIASLRRSSMYIPTELDDQPWQGKNEQVKGNDSQSSFQTKSRITSWTNSTMTSSAADSEINRKRLSVIREDGSPHQPSSSAGRHFGSVPTSQQRQSNVGFAVNGQRLYSALIKHIDQDDISAAVTEQLQTIRPVHSPPPTENAQAPDDEHREFSIGSNPWQEPTGLTPEKVRDNLARRKEQLKRQETQSTFFPYSNEDQSKAESPFRKYLMENRPNKQYVTQSDHNHESGTSRFNNTEDQQRQVNNHKSLLSSESVYSITTQGDVNPYYDRPGNCSMDIDNRESVTICNNGIDAASRLNYVNGSDKPTEEMNHFTTASGKLDCSDTTALLSTDNEPLPGDHVDGHASQHFDHQELSPVTRQSSSGPIKFIRMLRPSRSTMHNLMRISTPSTMAPEILSIPKKRESPSETGIASMNAFPSQSRMTPSNETVIKTCPAKTTGRTESSPKWSDDISVPLRRSSSRTHVETLKDKRSAPCIGQNVISRKENGIRTFRDITNMTTPSKTYTNDTAGNNDKISHNKQKLTPNGFHQRLRGENSPIETLKSTLSARLSRPFDMEIPELNRPFDSIYLGKREFGYGDMTGGRLSVAPYPSNSASPKGYGGMGTPVLNRVTKEDGETALPHFPTPEDEEKKFGRAKHFTTVSKRMVSDFLRSRRREGSSGELGEIVKEQKTSTLNSSVFL